MGELHYWKIVINHANAYFIWVDVVCSAMCTTVVL